MDHLLESWVSHQYSSIEEVYIWRCESSSIKLNHRSNVRWNHRKFSNDHILRFYPRNIEIDKQFDQTHHLLFLIYRFDIWKFFHPSFDLFFHVNRLEHEENSLWSWWKWDLISILIEKVSVIWLKNCRSKLEICDNSSHSMIFSFKRLLIFLIEFFNGFHFLSLFFFLFSLEKSIKFFKGILIISIYFFNDFIFKLIWDIFYYYIFYIGKNFFNFSSWNLKQLMDTSWWRFFIPFMYNRRCKINMSHSHSSFTRRCHLYSTLFTYDSLISWSFIFSTATFVVFYWSKDWFTKKSSLLWFSRSIVYGIRAIYDSTRPFFDLFHWSERNHQPIKFCIIHQKCNIRYKYLLRSFCPFLRIVNRLSEEKKSPQI